MTGPSTIAPPASPFKGLAAFSATDVDALLFFGRERESELIAANLMASRLTVLYGESGVGKTSLLGAGVVHRLRESARTNLAERGHPEFVVVMFSAWSGDPVPELAAAARQALIDLFGAAAVVEPEPGTSLADTLQAWTGDLGCDLLLVLDQFEEYFLYHESEAGAATFAEALPELVARGSVRVSVVLAIREDALAKLDRFKGAIPNLFGNYLRLDHLDRDAARAAIVGPIAERNRLLASADAVDIEPELVDAILDETATGRVELKDAGRGTVRTARQSGRIEAPYLQLVLERLWDEEMRSGSRTLRLATLRSLGGAAEIVRTHLARALESLDPAQKDIAASLFHHLVTPSGMKIAHGTRDLAEYAAVPRDEVTSVLSALVRERILRHAAARNGAAAGDGSPVEIFHDVLTDAVLAWRTKHEADRALERQTREAERRHRRTLAVATGSLLALALVSAVALFALIQRSRAQDQAAEARAQRAEAREAADRARSRELVARGATALSTDPRRSLELGIEAARLEDTPQVEQLLRNALVLDRLRAVVRVDRGSIVSAGFASGSKYVVVASTSGEVRIARRSGTVARVLRHPGRINAASLTPRGNTLVTAGDREARLWRIPTGRRLRDLAHPAGIVSVSFSSDGKVLATGSRDGRVRVWSVPDGRLIRVIDVTPPVSSVVMSPNGLQVVVIAGDRLPRLYQVETAALRLVLDHRGVLAVAFSPGGRLIATASADRTVRLWDARRAERYGSPLVGHRGRVTDVTFSPQATVLATASTDGTGRVWATDSGETITPLLGHGNFVVDVAFSADGNHVAGASTDRTARVWLSDNGSPVATFLGHRDSVRSVQFSRDGAWLLTTSDDRTARIWVSGVKPELRLFTRTAAPVTDAEFSPDGKLVLDTTAAGEVEIRAADTGRLVHSYRERRPVARAAFSPDGTLVAAASGRVLSIRNSRTGKLLARLVHPKNVNDVAFSRNGQLIASAGGDGLVRVWSARTLRPVRSLRGSRAPLTSVAFDPRGTRLAGGSNDRSVLVLDLRNGRIVNRLRGHRAEVTGVAFSGDGRLIASSSRDHDARVWDSQTGRLLRVLRGHFALVSDVAFSPDSRWIVTAGPQTAGLWDSRTGAPVLRLRGGLHRLTAAGFDPSGRRIVVGEDDRAVRLYDCELCGRLDELVAIAERRLARNR